MKSIDNLLTKQEDGKLSINSDTFLKNFRHFGFIATDDKPFGIERLHKMVDEFSYINRKSPADIETFLTAYGFDMKADSPFAEGDGGSVVINPYIKHADEARGAKKLPIKDHPLKTSLDLQDLNRIHVGKVIEARTEKYPDEGNPEPNQAPDSYKVVVQGLDSKGNMYEHEVWGTELKSFFEPDEKGNPPAYKIGDTLAIIHTGKTQLDEIDQRTGKPLLKNSFQIDKINPEQLSEAVKHYQETDQNYNRIARHGLGESGLDKFVKEEAGTKVVSLADMTLEDFNFVRGAEVKRITLAEKKAFDEQKRNYLNDAQNQGIKPKLEDFASKNGYDIKQGSLLDTDAARSLKIVTQVITPEASKKYLGKQNVADNTTSHVADNTTSQNQPSNSYAAGYEGGGLQIGATALLLSQLFSKFDTSSQVKKDIVAQVNDGWKNHTADEAMQKILSPRIGGNALADLALKQQIEQQITKAYELRLENIDKGLDVRLADQAFLEKTSQLYGVDPKAHEGMQDHLDAAMVRGDKLLGQAKIQELSSDNQQRLWDDLKEVYAEYAGDERLLSDHQFSQNTTRLKALDKGLENHLTHAYEARLKNITEGMDVRTADYQFSTHAKAIYGIEDDPRFDQSIKDTLIKQDQKKPSSPEQIAQNVQELKQKFTEQTQVFELVAENTAKKRLSEEPSFNPFEDPLRIKNAKLGMEDWGVDKKNLLTKLDEKLDQSASLLSRLFSKFVSGNRAPGNTPDGP